MKFKILFFISGLGFILSSCTSLTRIPREPEIIPAITSREETALPGISPTPPAVTPAPPANPPEKTEPATDEKELNLSIADKHCTKGMEFLEGEQYDLAIDQFIISLLFMPEHNRCQIALTQARDKLAEKQKRKLEQHNLEIAETYYDKGLIFLKRENYQSAVDNFKKALQLVPEHNKSLEALKQAGEGLSTYNTKKAAEYNDAGLKEYAQGNLKKAIELWEKALTFDPDNEESKMNIYRARKELQ